MRRQSGWSGVWPQARGRRGLLEAGGTTGPPTAGGRRYQHLDLRLPASALGGGTFPPLPASPVWGPRT